MGLLMPLYLKYSNGSNTVDGIQGQIHGRYSGAAAPHFDLCSTQDF